MALPLAHTAARLGPAATDALTHFRSPTMANGLTYALLPSLAPGAKPWGYASLQALARRIHRDRRGEALQLKHDRLRFRDHDRDVTAVYAEDQVGGRMRFLGYAWHAGRHWTALEAALAATVPAGLVEG